MQRGVVVRFPTAINASQEDALNEATVGSIAAIELNGGQLVIILLSHLISFRV
jgi:hypothetical protein